MEHSGFPLPPLDANGKPLHVGSTVIVVSVESCLSELPLEDQEHLRRIVGERRQIVAFDESGFAWLYFRHGATDSADFCLYPWELAVA